jgi:hypothetical protein
MELEYKEYSVRIVHNPSDVILRFTHKTSVRLWQVTLTERDFVEYQVLGGLEFAVSLLKGAINSEVYEISEFKETPKQLSFNILYNAQHCKVLTLQFVVPALKKESANPDMDDIVKRLASLEKVLTSQKQEIAGLKEDLNSQIEKVGGCVIFPNCPFAIPEKLLTLLLGKVDMTDPLTGDNYHRNNLVTLIANLHFYFLRAYTLKPLKYFKACETFRLVNADDVTDYSPIGEMTSLKHLHIVYSSSSSVLCKIDWITKLTNLESATFFNCKGLTDISPLCELKNLKTLDIRSSGVNNTAMLHSSIQITR